MTGECRRYLVRGRVQGVGFRWFARDLGAALGLAGWVRNLPDGRSVEALAQGPLPALDQFAAGLRRGPPGSFVEGMSEQADEPFPAAGFSIRT